MSCPRGNLRHNPAFFNTSRIEGDRREDGFSGMNIPGVDFRNKKKKKFDGEHHCVEPSGSFP